MNRLDTAQVSGVAAPDPLPSHEQMTHQAIRPPTTFREWEGGYLNYSSDPRIRAAMKRLIGSLSADQRRCKRNRIEKNKRLSSHTP